ncbi:hypothetical protein DOTSEDRAFT_75405 [Lecanosticta acicola]|uniref:Altered inheritance of mitochondria protein 11 n=1 Tax=Lecanosticta acicola TaxID=111012 RepID=A0AAI8W1F0_9PEZI|nr:hypothetical protein DOTSEDRAFT_75405 [Lecanosticta acicola]
MSSWWDKYLAPGDIRARNVQPESPSPSQSSNETTSTPEIPTRISASHRARRQNALLFGGLAFTFLSGVITRRALRRKHLATYPSLTSTKSGNVQIPHFAQSNSPPKAEGGLDAAEALFIATLTTTSLFMTATGAFMKYFDIADVEDLREFVRKGVGQDIYGGDRDAEADREIEAWMAEVLARKDGVGNLKESIVEKMAELEAKEKKSKGEEGGVLERVKQMQKEKGDR